MRSTTVLTFLLPGKLSSHVRLTKNEMPDYFANALPNALIIFTVFGLQVEHGSAILRAPWCTKPVAKTRKDDRW